MNCPHCNKGVKFNWDYFGPVKKISTKEGYYIFYDTCPNCEESVIYYSLCTHMKESYNYILTTNSEGNFEVIKDTLIYPLKKELEEIDSIPDKYLEDYYEAREVIVVSPKSSAALTRRLLQLILRDCYSIKEKNLSAEIQKFILLEGVPSHLSDAIDAIRNIGNLAAHPEKEINTGNIVSVEPGEAEWLLEVIESLFDFTFIQPQKLRKRRDMLNAKLNKIGKPQMKIK